MKKSERLNQELIFIHRKKQFNLRDLMTEFRISKRTALRDIIELEELETVLSYEGVRMPIAVPQLEILYQAILAQHQLRLDYQKAQRENKIIQPLFFRRTKIYYTRNTTTTSSTATPILF